MNCRKGFTLIEILIALTVFAILATITSGILYHSFSTRERVNAQADELNRLELALSLVQKDARHAVPRGVRGDHMMPFAPFIGERRYVELTVDGNINPKALLQRSTLKRVAYLCRKGQLIRRTWTVLDTPNRKERQDQVLLEHLQECHFSFLSDSLEPLNEWRAQAVSQNQKATPLPKAIQLTITLPGWGNASLYFVIPQALHYAKH